MKKSVVMISFLFAAIMLASFVSAQNNNESCDENCKIDNAYSCVSEKIDSQSCSSLSIEEQIFSVLSVGECTSDLVSESDDSECWPDGNCNLKTTAQAVFALERAGSSTSEAESWLISQNQTPDELTWYLQIDSTEETTCTVQYEGASNSLTIEEDKTISSLSGGNCLRGANSNYWLQISSDSDCQDNTYEVSCDKGFTTNLLYRKSNSDTIYVSDETHSASGGEGSTTEEKIDSYCFSKGGNCDYEGSLWAAYALQAVSKDYSSYLPYLVAMSDDTGNQRYLPETFLYSLTGEFKNELLLKQRSSKWWEATDTPYNRYYDSALALNVLQHDSNEEITNSKEWLFEVQGNDGCWNSGNLRDTAFLAYALQPRGVSSGDSGTSTPDCESAGNYCMSSASCTGDVLSSYSCAGTFVCCSQPKQTPTCSEQGGAICNSNEECTGGTNVDASGLDSGQVCCYGGSCQESSGEEVSACETAGGTCRPTGCFDDESSSNEDCDYGSDVCCLPQQQETSEGGVAWLWVVILLILISLVVVGIIYREKLRRFWLRLKSKFGKGKGQGGPSGPRGPRPPGFPPASPRAPPQRPFPRKMVPSRGPPRRGPPRGKPHHELNDVLGKLKKMGS